MSDCTCLTEAICHKHPSGHYRVHDDFDGIEAHVHMHAMTAEKLHSKAEIAIELGWRDSQIHALSVELEQVKGVNADLMRERREIDEALERVRGELAQAVHEAKREDHD